MSEFNNAIDIGSKVTEIQALIEELRKKTEELLQLSFAQNRLIAEKERPKHLDAAPVIFDALDLKITYVEMCLTVVNHPEWRWSKNLTVDSLREIRLGKGIKNEAKLAVIAKAIGQLNKERLGGQP